MGPLAQAILVRDARAQADAQGQPAQAHPRRVRARAAPRLRGGRAHPRDRGRGAGRRGRLGAGVVGRAEQAARRRVPREAATRPRALIAICSVFSPIGVFVL